MVDMSPALKAAMRDVAGQVDQHMDRLLAVPSGAEARVIDAMRYALIAPGKKLRPFLLVTAADMLGVPRSRSLQAACAVECVHTYSLIHDDLPAMDDDDLRRGRPAGW